VRLVLLTELTLDVKGTEKMLRRMKEELTRQKSTNAMLQSDLDSLRGISSTDAGSRTRESGRATPSSDGDLQRKLQALTTQHTALQSELGALRSVLTAREREVEVLRSQSEETSREIDALREELDEAHGRIAMLLDVGQSGFDHDTNKRRDSAASSDEATMAFDKVGAPSRQY
jgi:chromosome segregation ATPase